MCLLSPSSHLLRVRRFSETLLIRLGRHGFGHWARPVPVFSEMSMLNGRFFLKIVFIVAVLVMAWIAAGISLLDDDWGHLKLASQGIVSIFTTGWEGLVGQGGYYRPVVVLSFYLDYLIGGFHPAVYHITNVAIHTICAFLVFVFIRCLERGIPVACGSALLFFMLPIHTDSVFWIVGRTDSICALFYLGALILFLKHLNQANSRLLVGFAICCAMAFFSKEMALSLPGALVVLMFYKRAWKNPAAQRGLGVMLFVLLVYLFIRLLVLGSVFGGTPRVSILAWGLDGLKAVAKMGLTDVKWFGIAVLAATAGILFYEKVQENSRGARGQGGKGDFLVLSCSPTPLLIILTLVSLSPALGHLHNWYLYLPSAFFCMSISVVWLEMRRRVFYFLFGALVLYYAVVMGREGLFWQATSKISEGVVAGLMPHAQETSGRLFVLNVPSAWTPDGSLGGKPVFAYALKNALTMRASKPLPSELVVVNHVWLTGSGFQCEVEPEDGGFELAIGRGGFFSFFGKSEGWELPIDQSWGHVVARGIDSLSVVLNTRLGDRVVVYDRGEFQKLFP